MAITHLFFDVGGVLGTPGWESAYRMQAALRFGLDRADFERRHQAVVQDFEEGRLTLAEYLDRAVFHQPRAFSRAAFFAFMRRRSRPHPEALALARALRATGRYRLMTINNESAELNEYRLRCFGLIGLFDAFFSSCWVGAMKPAPRIYEVALEISQAVPERSVFIDDREENLVPARALGMHALRFTGVRRLAADLTALGVAVPADVG
jgi:putative hydrolase of the HAD superfamily